ncbi:MAG: type IV toxin-antitoxin system AbiEi family antitoxin domain-containing protein [Gammaproteobacteria bacterium]
MSRQKNGKLNYLLKHWPKGTIAVQNALNQQGIYRQLADSYVKHHWLMRLAPGVYAREGDEIRPEGALYALQQHLQLPIHIGGRSALERLGFAHFVPMQAKEPLYLFQHPQVGMTLPKWFKKMFSKNASIYVTHKKLFSSYLSDTLIGHAIGEYHVKMSCVERAILETLALVPEEISLSQTKLLFEGLHSCRSDVFQYLLEHCTSVKVKRLFLLFSEHERHNWFKYLNLEKINFGKGKRVISGGGVYYPKHELSLPEDVFKDESHA